MRFAILTLLKVTYEEIERYVLTGLGTPPHCEISLKADSDETTPPDLVLNIILSRVKDSCNKLKISRAAEWSGQLHNKLIFTC